MNNKIFYSITLGLLIVCFSTKGMQVQFKKAVKQGNMCVVEFFLNEGAEIADEIIRVAREAKQDKMVMFLLRKRAEQRMKEYRRKEGIVGKEEFAKIGADDPQEYAKEERKGISFQEMMRRRRKGGKK